MQLQPGDLLLTGSPSGNGTHYQRFLKPDELVEGSITGLGVQRNRCVPEQVSAEQAGVRFQRVEKFPGRTNALTAIELPPAGCRRLSPALAVPIA